MNSSTPVPARLAAAFLLLIPRPEAAYAAISHFSARLSADGWHTWRVAAVAETPTWCCFEWSRGVSSPVSCDLDRRHGGYQSSERVPEVTGQIQVYALIESGVTTQLLALSPQCPVTSTDPVADLGLVDVDLSLAWLEDRVGEDSPVGSDAIAAIAAHESESALEFLLDAAGPASDPETREEAIFWMAQLRIGDSADAVRRFMFSDDDAQIREHAGFAYSQSSAPDRVDALIRQAREDRDPEVRSQALFWLAQTEATRGEAEIRRAIRSDSDPDVREEAVFALSQLPQERAVSGLVSLVEDRRLDRELREEALFWLVQSESEEAFAFLERLLDD